MSSREEFEIVAEDLSETKHLLGKYLCHVRRTANHGEGESPGFVFCFGDESDSQRGKMVMCRLETHDGKTQLRLYGDGNWCDEEEVLYESPDA